MVRMGSASFEQHFQNLQDPRVERTRKHPLINVVFMLSAVSFRVPIRSREFTSLPSTAGAGLPACWI